MKKINMLKSIVAIAVILALVLPGSAVFAKDKKTIDELNNDTNNESSEFMLIDADYISQSQTNTFDLDWIYFDNGYFYTGIAESHDGGAFEAAIRITPDELGDYDSWYLTTVKFYHSDSGAHSGNIKIYEAGASTHPGDLITSEPYTVTGNGWKDIPLSKAVAIDACEDIWVSVEITHAAGEYPMGADNGPAVDGKGDWFYSESQGWIELQYYNLNYNWNIWAGVEEDTTPTVTTCDLDGIMEGGVYITDVTVTLTATDDASGVNYTMYKLNDGEWQGYVPFVVSDDGAHTVSFYSIDNAGNTENTKNETFTIQKPCSIEIEVSGGIGVNVVITNTGGTDVTDLEWSIIITGGLLGLIDKEVNGTIPILEADDSATVKSGIFFGIGQISVTVTAGCAEETVDGKQFIIFTKVG